MAAYAQPLLDEAGGSQEQMQNAISIAQTEKEQRDSLAKMQPALKMDNDEFNEFCESIVVPMIGHHHEMFPSMMHAASETIHIKETLINSAFGDNTSIVLRA